MSLIQTEGLLQVTLEPMGSRVQVTPGSTLLECAQKAGVDINAVCGGHGTCGLCKVILMQGQVSPLDPAESVLLESTEIKRGLRLACQTRVFSDARVQFPPESLATLQRLQLEGQETSIRPHPAVRWVDGERRVVFNGRQMVSNLPAGSPVYGYAVDIGTTKIAGYLVDLQSWPQRSLRPG